jgi:DNA-binding transcriptional MerR regulator
MAWSTAELAELAGTSLRAVRHYHAVGLLEVPERGPNGWKRYGLAHLTRLREIVRLRDLGLSIAEIDDLHHGGSLPDALARLDEQLGRSMERLQAVRDEVSALAGPEPLRSGHLALPPGLPPIDLDVLDESDRLFLVLMSCLIDAPALADFVGILQACYADPVIMEFAALPADAPEATRVALAEAMVEPTRRIRASFPSLEELAERGSANPARTLKLMRTAMADDENAAQVDVRARVELSLASHLSTTHRANSNVPSMVPFRSLAREFSTGEPL